jgi:PAS domain S-box-containing protein
MNNKTKNKKPVKDKYYGLFNKIADPIFIFDKENCRFLDSNVAAMRNYGYTKDEIKKMSLLDLHPQNEVERVKKAVKIINKDVPFTFTHIKKNGVRISVEMLSDHIDFEGKRATITIVRDVSDRVKVEKELKRQAIQNSLLYEIGQRLTSELDLDTLLRIVVTSIRDAFDYYGVMILLMDKDGKKLVMQSISGGYSKVFPHNMQIEVGEGMIGQAALTRQTQISGDVTKNPNYVMKAKEVTKSELSVPLMKGDRIIGILDFQSDKENAFDKSDVTAAETLSSQIASAIENAHLYNQAQFEIEDRQKAEKEAQRRATHAALINQISQRVTSQLDLDLLLSEIVNSVRDAFDYYGVLLLTLDEKNDMLTLAAIAGVYSKYFSVGEVALKVGQGMVGQAALKKEVQISGNVEENPHYISRAEESTKSEISVPIISDDRVIGVLDVESEEYDAFDESDVTVLTTICSQIFTAIENARLFQKAQKEISERQQAEKALRRSKNNLQSAKRETDTILENVEEGLFILDTAYKIGSQFSIALTEILHTKNLGHNSFLDFLRNYFDDNILDNVKDYLDLLLNSDIDEETLIDLNPLSQVEMTFQVESELLSVNKVLAFRFRRIFSNGKISGLISTVNDITEQVRLAKKLELSEEQSKRQMEWFLSILHVEPEMLKQFIDSAHSELNEIEHIFKEDKKDCIYHQVLEKIYRSVHLIKGNASLLDLKFYAKKAHDFEEEIEILKKKKDLCGKDFIPLVMCLSEMRSGIDEINSMIDKISRIHTHFRPKSSFESKKLVKSIENLVRKISKDYHKEVQFAHEDFKGENIPYQYRILIKDILIQLARNSLKHGIEMPEEREKCGKNRSGLIEIATYTNNGTFRFKLRDDGRGLQIGKIKERLIQSGKWRAEEIDKWNERKIARMIFESGISTSDSTDIVAGRGVGMNIIYEKVKNHKGKIDIAYEQGKYLEFIVSLPHTTLKKGKRILQTREEQIHL